MPTSNYEQVKFRVNEPIDENDDDCEDDIFCGTGYVVLTTYEQVRQLSDVYVNHLWSYVILDEGQKIRNPDTDVTLACKVWCFYFGIFRHFSFSDDFSFRDFELLIDCF